MKNDADDEQTQSEETREFSPFLWDKKLAASLPGEPNHCLSFSLKINKTPPLVTELVLGSVKPDEKTKLLRLVQTWLVGAGTLRGVEMQETPREKIHASRTFAKAAELCGQTPHKKFEVYLTAWQEEEALILQQLKDADVSFLTTRFVYLTEVILKAMVDGNLTSSLFVRWPFVAWNPVFVHFGLAKAAEPPTAPAANPSAASSPPTKPKPAKTAKVPGARKKAVPAFDEIPPPDDCPWPDEP
jgi:hypothetical protein